MGDRGFDFFTLFVYLIQLAPSGGAFLAEMAGQQVYEVNKNKRGAACMLYLTFVL